MSNAHAACIRHVVEAAELEGLRPERVLTQAGLERSAELVMTADFTAPDERFWLPMDRAFAVWDRISVLLSVPRFFHDLITVMPVEGLGPVGFRVLTASTLLESLQYLTHDFEVVTDSGYWERRLGGRSLKCVWHRPAFSIGQAAANEAVFAHVVDILSNVAGHEVRPSRVTLQHDALCTKQALSDLLVTRIEYAASENSLTFPLTALQGKPRLSNRAMATYFQDRVREQLDLLRSTQSIVGVLRRELRSGSSLSAESLCEASARMAMSERTLQRRLAEAGTSFAIELERARSDRAFRLVTSTSRTIADIAQELGFADSSTFSRAFRRWFAKGPSSLRRAKATNRVWEPTGSVVPHDDSGSQLR